MRIAFVGLPLAPLLLVADGHQIVLAGVRTGLTLGLRRLRRTIGDHQVVVDPHHDWPSFRDRVDREQPDLLVSWYFTRKIPMDVVACCRLGGIGVHPSLLPRHRGPDPFFAAIDAGDEVTGVTVHRIAEQYDTGDVLRQRTVPIDPAWNAWQLARALDRPSLSALRDVVRAASAGDPLAGTPQNPRDATSAPFPTDDDRLLRWSQPAAQIVRRVRALAPYPGAVAFAGDVSLVVTAAEVRPVHAVLHPGEAAILDGVAVVRASDEGVALLRAEVDGADWDARQIAQQIGRCREK